MHCAACWEHLKQEEDKQDQALSRIDRVWGILQARRVGPTSGEELAGITDKSSVARYLCPNRVQSQENAWNSTEGQIVELFWLTSIQTFHTTHTHTSIHQSQSPYFYGAESHTPVSRISVWPSSGQAEKHIPLASVTGLRVGT